jgi:hypothetical protein
MRVVCKLEEQHRLIKEFHDSAWAGHRGVWAVGEMRERKGEKKERERE